MSVILLVISFTIIFIYEAPEMIRSKQYREFILFTGLLLFGFVVSFLQTIGVPVPNPIKSIETLTEKVARLFH
ncbi:MAG TPA: hypothetical protein GX506_01440 [Firmicutes bacterium]|nr:hypothetical protein [Bacillota bacterium]